MPRFARRYAHPAYFLPNTSYHVTARGCDRMALYHTDTDRRIFLSCLAESCDHFGVVCLDFCLMSNHVHLVIEDVRGVISQFMHRLFSVYARYFNDTRALKRRGPVLEDRFHAEVLDSEAYLRAACAYVLLNPLRCSTPLADSPELYRWSSASFTLAAAEVTAAAFCASFFEDCGGPEAFLAALPKAKRKSSQEMRRKRIDVLLSGTWLHRERSLAGRTPEAYRRMLLASTKLPRPTSKSVAEDGVWAASEPRQQEATSVARERTPFRGVELERSLEAAEATCGSAIPRDPDDCALEGTQTAGVVAYTLWRFTSETAEAIAAMLKTTVGAVIAAIERARKRRTVEGAWRDLIRSVEWTLRWRLRAGPCRW